MEKKKNVKANLEKSKSIFIMIGLILAISFIAYAFSWESKGKFVDIDNATPIPEEDFSKVTWNDKKKEEKFKKPPPKKVIADVLKIVDDTTKIVEIGPMWTPEDTIIFDDPIIIENDEPFTIVEEPPVFPGGETSLRAYIAKRVVYPSVARENGIQGTVFLRFEVTKFGTIGKIEIFNKDEDEILKKASVDVIKNLSKFKPGMQNGQKVNVWLSIPISFKLN